MREAGPIGTPAPRSVVIGIAARVFATIIAARDRLEVAHVCSLWANKRGSPLSVR
jgi:hypothetical protein